MALKLNNCSVGDSSNHVDNKKGIVTTLYKSNSQKKPIKTTVASIEDLYSNMYCSLKTNKLALKN